MAETREGKRVPVVEGLFHESVSPGGETYLIGSKCHVCGTVFFPRKVVCPLCARDDTMQEVHIGRKAWIDTFVVARVAPEGFSAPYTQAYVNLAEGPRVFTLITGCEPTEGALSIGEEVELVIEKLRVDEEGNDIVVYKYRPVRVS